MVAVAKARADRPASAGSASRAAPAEGHPSHAGHQAAAGHSSTRRPALTTPRSACRTPRGPGPSRLRPPKPFGVRLALLLARSYGAFDGRMATTATKSHAEVNC